MSWLMTNLPRGGFRELDRGTFNVYPSPPPGPLMPYSQLASALVTPLNPDQSAETWVLFQNYVPPHLTLDGTSVSAIRIEAAHPEACAPGLAGYNNEFLPSAEAFVAAMAELAAQRGQTYTVLDVVSTRRP